MFAAEKMVVSEYQMVFATVLFHNVTGYVNELKFFI